MVNSVVPQEHFLVPPTPSPNLIIIYINYLPNSISSIAKVMIFADDYISYRTIECEEYTEMLQIHLDLDELKNWKVIGLSYIVFTLNLFSNFKSIKEK